jgi:adenylate cyclase class 2
MEIEIKLHFDSVEGARNRIESLGGKLVDAREFEDNTLFDFESQSLAADGKLLRLRRYGSQSLLTFKAPAPGRHRHKVRIEHETPVGDPAAMERMLDGLGFQPGYRYQKFRTGYALDGLHLCLDETPLGCFVELEGDPESIDRVAAQMGFTEHQYICDSYRELHRAAAAKRGEPAGNMLFDESN